MAIKELEDGMISDDFEIGAEPHLLKDALIMTAEQYNALTPDEIAALKQQRYDNWMAVLSAPPANEPVQE